MASTITADAARLEAVLLPYLRQLLKDAPPYGEVSFTAVIHDGDVARVKLGAEVSRTVAPRSGRGGAR